MSLNIQKQRDTIILEADKKKITSDSTITHNVHNPNEKKIGSVIVSNGEWARSGSVRGNRYGSLDPYGTFGLDPPREQKEKEVKDVELIFRDETLVVNYENPLDKPEGHLKFKKSIEQQFAEHALRTEAELANLRTISEEQLQGSKKKGEIFTAETTPARLPPISSLLGSEIRDVKGKLKRTDTRVVVDVEGNPINVGSIGEQLGRRFGGGQAEVFIRPKIENTSVSRLKQKDTVDFPSVIVKKEQLKGTDKARAGQVPGATVRPREPSFQDQ